VRGVLPLRDRFPAPAVMGVVNVTPDSFSDGGAFLDPGAAVAHGLRLAAEGADVLDVGGESTRPGSDPVPLAVELERVLPVIEGLARATDVPISIDTVKAAVAERAIRAGAGFVNDVSALRHDPAMAGVVAEAGVPVCLMHMLGEPKTMQRDPRYRDVVAEVSAFLAERVEFARASGISPDQICIDPGIGFGKTADHNLMLLRHLDRIAAVGPPVLLGVSRKSFLGVLTGEPDSSREVATVAVNLDAVRRGAWMLRVHAVTPTRQALAVAAAIEAAP
jgi:dihydropteroate synthase